MAIPFAFPSDEDTEANYQRLDQLLSDLYVVLQQILVTQRRIRDAQPSQLAQRIRNGQAVNARRTGDVSDISVTSAPVFPPSEPPRSPRMLDADFALEINPSSTSASESALTDRADLFRLGASITENSTTGDRSPTRRHRRRRRTSSESSCCDETKNNIAEVAPTTTTPDWTQVGVNLRKIADDFYASVGKDENPVQVSEDSKLPCESADASLLSMLVPPPFGGSIWTAVLFVVGWRLLARAR